MFLHPRSDRCDECMAAHDSINLNREPGMQYMIIESFIHGPRPVYERFRERGRLAPEGLTYVSSVVTEDGTRCSQLMESDDRRLIDEWIAAWSDIVSFEVVPVIASAEAARRFA